MENQFLRTEMVLGADGMDALRRSHVAVFGLGAVSYTHLTLPTTSSV